MMAHYPPKKILVPTDFSPSSQGAMDYAVTIARATGAMLLPLHVLDPSPTMAAAFPQATGTAVVGWSEALRARREAITGLLSQFREQTGAEICLDGLLIDGHPAAAIAKAALDHDCDLIVMASHGRRGLTRALMGSVAEHTVRVAELPVLVVR